MSEDLTVRGTFYTDAGMLAVWTPEDFAGIVEYEDWETELLEDADIERHIKEGSYVPLYIHSDGAFAVEIRVGTVDRPAAVTKRQAPYVTVTSEPYLLRSKGRLCVGGIEHVEIDPPEWVGRMSLPAVDYAVVVSLIDWAGEPNSRGEDGRRSADALPDFLVLLNPVSDGVTFRTKVDTFDRP